MQLLSPFKAIALFTPGGDVAYCIDTDKRKHWHVHLCAELQEALNLSESPHFLLHYYKATVDAWWDNEQNALQITATAMPAVIQYRALLNHLFQIPGTPWQLDTIQSDLCETSLLQQYQQDFPELWEFHDLILPVTQSPPDSSLQETQMSTITMSTLATMPRTDTASRSVNRSIAPSRSSSQPPQSTPHMEPDRSGRYVLRLFVSCRHSSTEAALRNLHRALERSMLQPYTLQVIDISKYPEQAEFDQVTATPTLLRVHPLPHRRLVGDLENEDQLLHLLAEVDLDTYH
jgi:circadian clock protein KaiB